jgi:uncharacterized protein (TIGR02598 family)
MKRSINIAAAFSLVELTLALGLAAFCLIAVFGLIPVAALTSRNASSHTTATNILSAIIADLRATPAANATSGQFGITFGTPKTLYFDGSGQFSTSPSTNSRYQLNVTFSQQSPAPAPPAVPTIYADLKVTWPAAATPENATGSTEMFAAFNRN